MKVLFAVSNDNITTSVVNRYQQKYKEIITSKNVYYFNAIIKELQNDKTYDAVVIGEDLEPISNGNYEAVDKFLFEKLDGISDEASKPTGEDIPIILICSDRRTKSDQLLVKLFGIGIYNALIENDRSVESVCNLINKPRSKKEAKRYYKLESDQVDYKAENDEEVKESEIQNILAHYKKIGTNEKKCVQSFDSIAEQYDDTQLRIIVKFLPMEIKAILEANSPKYQKLMINGTVLSNGKYNQYKTNNNPKNPATIDFLEKDLEKPKLTKPVIIPSTMNTNNVRKIQNRAKTPSYNNIGDDIFNQNGVLPGIEDNTSNNAMENKMYQNTSIIGSEESRVNQNSSMNVSKKNNNGSYTNNISETQIQPTQVVKPEPIQTVKKGRGRPKKNAIPEVIEEQNNIEEPVIEKKRRGRPKKTDSTPNVEQIGESVNNINLQDNDENMNLSRNMDNENNELQEDSQPLNLFGLDEDASNINGANENDAMTLPGLNDFDDDITQSINSNPYEASYNQINSYDTNIYNQNGMMDSFENSNMNRKDLESSNTKQTNIQYQSSIQNPNNNMQYQNVNLNNDENMQYKSMNSNGNADMQYENMNLTRNQQTKNYENNNVIVGNGKVVAFVGTTKNGTSFIVNNLAQLLSQSGINTAIVDLTQNKNSYYMFTDNEPELMRIATESMTNLENGIMKGINVNRNLTVFTELPEGMQETHDANKITKNASNNFEVILLDCDFETEESYFVFSNEIYLVQSMDAFTIQPLTQFLSNLKLKNILDESKLRIIINKYIKMKRLDDKMIIGGMSKYNEPSMTLQRDLFNPNTIKNTVIPFEEQTYARYLESIAMCQLSLAGYSQNFLASLEQLKNMVYPLISSNNNNQYSQKQYGNYENNKKNFWGSKNSSMKFSNNVNDTLNKMRTNKY